MKKIILVLCGMMMVSCITLDGDRTPPDYYGDAVQVDVFINQTQIGSGQYEQDDTTECPKCECILKETPSDRGME